MQLKETIDIVFKMLVILLVVSIFGGCGIVMLIGERQATMSEAQKQQLMQNNIDQSQKAMQDSINHAFAQGFGGTNQ